MLEELDALFEAPYTKVIHVDRVVDLDNLWTAAESRLNLMYDTEPAKIVGTQTLTKRFIFVDEPCDLWEALLNGRSIFPDFSTCVGKQILLSYRYDYVDPAFTHKGTTASGVYTVESFSVLGKSKCAIVLKWKAKNDTNDPSTDCGICVGGEDNPSYVASVKNGIRRIADVESDPELVIARQRALYNAVRATMLHPNSVFTGVMLTQTEERYKKLCTGTKGGLDEEDSE